MKRVGVIDVGTNSVLMVIAELAPLFKIIADLAQTTRLGEGLYKTPALKKEAISRTVHTIKNFLSYSDQNQVDKVFIVGTSALREACNSQEFSEALVHETGYSIRVLSEKEEAYYSYIAAVYEEEFGNSGNAVIDIGGGSTEFILGKGRKIEKSFSFNIGCVHLTERYYFTDPPESREIKNSQEEVLTYVSGLPEEISKYRLVGTGGTITTLAAIKLKLDTYKSDLVHKLPLKFPEILSIQKMLLSKTCVERRSVQGLEEKRADIIIAGTEILLTFMKHFGIEEVITSVTGLRYGILNDYKKGVVDFL